MSSVNVRTAFDAFIKAQNAGESFVTLEGEYEELYDFLEANGITSRDPWVGIQYLGNEEIPINVGSNNSSGLYKEMGSIFIHIVDIAKINGAIPILTRAEAIRDTLRGQRIGDIVIESVGPPSYESGATLQFEGGYMSATFAVDYYYDRNL